MTSKMVIALVGLGSGALPHLRSLQDLKDRVELRYAFARQPRADRIQAYTGRVHLLTRLNSFCKTLRFMLSLLLPPRLHIWIFVSVALLLESTSC